MTRPNGGGLSFQSSTDRWCLVDHVPADETHNANDEIGPQRALARYDDNQRHDEHAACGLLVVVVTPSIFGVFTIAALAIRKRMEAAPGPRTQVYLALLLALLFTQAIEHQWGR